MLVKIFTFLFYIPLGIVLLLLATIVFDVLHVCLHRCAASGNKLLRELGALHTTHHQFLDTRLHIHDELITRNVFRHVLPEFIVQVLVTLGLSIWFPRPAVIVALLMEVGVFISIMWGKPGIDINHKHIDQLKPYEPLYFCMPEYHLLHHVYPDAHFSSWIKTLDHLLGTGLSLHNRYVLVTDVTSPYAVALINELEAKGCSVKYFDTAAHSSQSVATLGKADILLLNHDGSGKDYERWLTAFYEQHQHDRVPVEVWEWYSDASQRAAARQRARMQFKLQQVIYRQLWSSPDQPVALVARKLIKGLQRGDNVISVGSWF